MVNRVDRVSQIRHELATTAVVCASVMVALLVSSAPAQAAWQAPGKPDSRYHCSGYNKEDGRLWFQDCVIVARSSSGASVQSVMAVSNVSSSSVSLYGATETYLVDGGRLTDTDCGPTSIPPRARKWCWGKTAPVAGHGRDVRGRGWLTRHPSLGWHDVWSPPWTT